MSCGEGHRHGLDLALLWLWCRPTATAPIRPLAWERRYAARAAQEMAKRKKQKQTKNPPKNQKTNKRNTIPYSANQSSLKFGSRVGFSPNLFQCRFI